MAYEQLVSLLDPGQFAQMQLVRRHLLASPQALDNHVAEETENAKQETIAEAGS